MCGGPDRLELFLSRHAVQCAYFMGDDRCPHCVGAAFVGEVAEAMESPFAASDPDREEDAGDIACPAFGHTEHAGSLKQRR